MSSDVAISLFGPAIYTENWMGFYESLTSNEVPFEIVFVGHRAPEFTLPDNFHFIYSEVKPAQCAEIASRYAVGDYVLAIADDVVFSEHALDKMYKMHRSFDCDKIMISCRYILNKKDVTDEAAYYWWGEKKSPRMPVAGILKRSMWKQLGGIDRRFVALCWHLDIAMRFYEIGGAVGLCEDAWIEEIESTRRLYADVGAPVDRPLLDWFWVRHTEPPEGAAFSSCIHYKSKEKGVISRTRLSPVVPFDDQYILTRSQGPKGKWR
ncbi:MAG: hypothetical protein A2Z25_15830 [Planctomycetes bacterium RBG_16_55_9]|nr:MAG: hypothetical protein A2Z25_15830 [Planctomycetes bacterium RBG_16_55_9]